MKKNPVLAPTPSSSTSSSQAFPPSASTADLDPWQREDHLIGTSSRVPVHLDINWNGVDATKRASSNVSRSSSSAASGRRRRRLRFDQQENEMMHREVAALKSDDDEIKAAPFDESSCFLFVVVSFHLLCFRCALYSFLDVFALFFVCWLIGCCCICSFLCCFRCPLVSLEFLSEILGATQAENNG